MMMSEVPSKGETGLTDTQDMSVWDARLAQLCSERVRRIREASEPVPGTVSYGAANAPHDNPFVFAADWRENLPEGDPRRFVGPPITRNGTVEAYQNMQAAHGAIRNAYGLGPEPSDI
jgi:hypothetical protein